MAGLTVSLKAMQAVQLMAEFFFIDRDISPGALGDCPLWSRLGEQADRLQWVKTCPIATLTLSDDSARRPMRAGPQYAL